LYFYLSVVNHQLWILGFPNLPKKLWFRIIHPTTYDRFTM
jgi:hypothetical protein